MLLTYTLITFDTIFEAFYFVLGWCHENIFFLAICDWDLFIDLFFLTFMKRFISCWLLVGYTFSMLIMSLNSFTLGVLIFYFASSSLADFTLGTLLIVYIGFHFLSSDLFLFFCLIFTHWLLSSICKASIYSFYLTLWSSYFIVSYEPVCVREVIIYALHSYPKAEADRGIVYPLLYCDTQCSKAVLSELFLATSAIVWNDCLFLTRSTGL